MGSLRPFDSPLVTLRLTTGSLRTFSIGWLAMSETSFRRRRNEGESNGAGNGIRTRDFDLGKVALYH